MDQTQFERILDNVAKQLTHDMQLPNASVWLHSLQTEALSYEQRVRELLHNEILEAGEAGHGYDVSLSPSGQAFPDIPCGKFGVEVKFTKADNWTSIANSIRETRRDERVEIVYLMFGKMGGTPESRWGKYEDCVVHVRTSHEPRFQVDMTGTKDSLFEQMGISYDSFRKLDIMDKMPYIRKYARKIHEKDGQNGRLWWLEDSATGNDHSTDINLIAYPDLSDDLKERYRAEAILLIPAVVATGSGGKGRTKTSAYCDVAMYFMTYHGVLLYNARDTFSAGSVGNSQGIIRLQKPMSDAAHDLDSALFKEYWEEDIAEDDRLAWWLEKADKYASDWNPKPSELMFLECQKKRKG